MHRRTNTDDQLDAISRKNVEGKRRSLLIEGSWSDEASSDKSEKDVPIEEPKVPTEKIDDNSSTAKTSSYKSVLEWVDVDTALHDLTEVVSTRKRKPGKSSKSDNKSAQETYISKFGDLKFKMVTTTIFDAQYFKESEVYGIYVLFWSGIGFFIFSGLCHYYFEETGHRPIWDWPIVHILRRDLVKVALTDLAMYISSYGVFFIQVMVYNKWFTWFRVGWVLQAIHCLAFFFFFLWFARFMNFPWIAKVFLVLHSLVFIMKMHSYGFYNGYLWSIYRELEFSKEYLNRLSNGDVSIGKDRDETKIVRALEESIAFCVFELASQAFTENVDQNGDASRPPDAVEFPNNITLFNYFEYSMFPTVVYTLNFPRNPKIRWWYVFEKVCGIFGILFLMVTIAHKSLFPLVIQCIEARKLTGQEKLYRYLMITLDIIPPFLLEYLLTFFMIWDVILNSLAELTRYSERDFYGPWWSCTDWSEFSRIWNKPVHKFLLRHVYHSSISTFKLNKAQAAMVTFLISSIVHELVMYVIFNNIRGYLLFLQMTQIPMIVLSRTKFMSQHKILGNVICWVGFITAPSVICTSYLMY